MFIDGRVMRVAGVVKVFGQLLARGEAAVHPDELHQIDDGVMPVELLMMLGGQPIEHGLDVHLGQARSRRGCCGVGTPGALGAFGTAWATGTPCRIAASTRDSGLMPRFTASGGASATALA